MDEAVGSSEAPAFLLCGVLSRDGPPRCQSALCGSTPNRAVRLLSFLEAVLSLRLSCAPLFSRRCSLTDPHTHPNKTIHPHIPHASDIVSCAITKAKHGLLNAPLHLISSLQKYLFTLDGKAQMRRKLCVTSHHTGSLPVASHRVTRSLCLI